MGKMYLYISVITLLLASCTGGLYSHYPKVKKQQATKEATKKEVEVKPILMVEQLNSKQITQQIVILPEPKKSRDYFAFKTLAKSTGKEFCQTKSW